jgi:hypothetical protein
MTRLEFLISFFKEKEAEFSTQQILFALEDGALLKDLCTDDDDQENIEFIHDLYTQKLEEEEIEELFSSDAVANDPQAYELEKDYSENFTKPLSISDQYEILRQLGRI